MEIEPISEIVEGKSPEPMKETWVWSPKNRWSFSMVPATLLVATFAIEKLIKYGLQRWQMSLAVSCMMWVSIWAVFAWVIWPFYEQQKRTGFPYSRFGAAVVWVFFGGYWLNLVAGLWQRADRSWADTCCAIAVTAGLGIWPIISGFRTFYDAIRIAGEFRRPEVPSAFHERETSPPIDAHGRSKE